MEISKMLTISTAHITEETAKRLQNDNHNGVIVYQKDEYGWFIFVDEDCMHEYENEIPKELFRLMKFTKANGCDWLCLDNDGEELEYFETYEW